LAGHRNKGGADQWVLKRRYFPGFARVNTVTSSSLGYPLSLFNKTLLSNDAHLQFFLPGTLSRLRFKVIKTIIVSRKRVTVPVVL